MNILYITRLLSQQGAPRTAILTCKSLNDMGNKTKLLFVKNAHGEETYKDMLRNMDFTILHNANHKGPFTWFYDIVSSMFMYDRKGILRIDLDLLKGVRNHLDVKDYDYIVCQNRWAGISGYYIWKKYKIPYCVLIQERLHIYDKALLTLSNGKERKATSRTRNLFFFIFGGLTTMLEKKVLANSTWIFGTTERISDSVILKYPEFKKKVITNYRGLDFTYFGLVKFRPYLERENIIIVDSQWDNGRNPFVYINIAENLEDYRIILTGGWRDSELQDRFLDVLREKEVSNLELITEFTQLELISLFSKAKFSIRFGFGEIGLPNAFMLSVTAGTPMITNEEMGASEIIGKLGGGIVVGDIDDILQIIKESDNEQWYETKQSELRKISETLTWEKHAKKLIDGVKSNLI